MDWRNIVGQYSALKTIGHWQANILMWTYKSWSSFNFLPEYQQPAGILKFITSITYPISHSDQFDVDALWKLIKHTQFIINYYIISI